MGKQLFAVEVNGVDAPGNAVEVDLIIDRGKTYARSFNPSLLRIDASFIYNAGYYAGDTATADQDFALTAAHEFGHTVLMEFGGIGHSWTHKGSTSIFQTTKSTTPGYPKGGEIDLMQYYDGEKYAPTFSRIVRDTRASDLDIKCLLWVSRLSF